MVGAGGFRCEQQKHQIDRLAVERLEIDSPFEPSKQSEQLIELGQLAVRNGDAVAHAGRTKLLALLQRLQDGPLTLAAELGGLRRQFLQDLLLAVDLQCRNDGIGRDKIGEEHGAFRRWGARQGSASQRRRTISSRWWPVNGVLFGGHWRTDPGAGAAPIALDVSIPGRLSASRSRAFPWGPCRPAVLAPALVPAQPLFDAHGRLIGADISICRERVSLEHNAGIEMDHALGAEAESLPAYGDVSGKTAYFCPTREVA